MTLTGYNNGGAWDFLISLKEIKCCIFQRIDTNFVEKISHYAFKQFVNKKAEYITLKRLVEYNEQFIFHFEVL